MDIKIEIQNFLKEKGILSQDKKEVFVVLKGEREVVINDLIQEFYEMKVSQTKTED